jgi:hypothetical protein
MNTNKVTNVYEVLNPWAEVDPVPLHSIVPRVTDPDGRTIGLYCNVKRSAPAIMDAVEQRLKERFPKARFSRYLTHKPNVPEVETEGKEEFEQWVSGVDTVAAAVGD